MKHHANRASLTVGIPAYNEEANITQLIGDLLSQNTQSIRLDRIVVVSDASTDTTNCVIQNIKDTRIQIIINKARSGQMISQNKILSACTSDILVFVNADIRIQDSKFLEKITLPIRNVYADLTSCRVIPVSSAGIFEHTLQVSAHMKQDIYEQYQSGQNIYTCHGRARAFSRRLYSQLRFNNIMAEDAFSYLFCRIHGMMYRYIPTTSVYYRLPTSIADHLFQSVRFLQSKNQLSRSFPTNMVTDAFRLPRSIISTTLLKYFRRQPLAVLYYLLILSLMHIMSRIINLRKPIWKISTSSKHVQT